MGSSSKDTYKTQPAESSLVFSSDPSNPMRGRSPLHNCVSAKLLAQAETVLEKEARIPPGRFFRFPGHENAENRDTIARNIARGGILIGANQGLVEGADKMFTLGPDPSQSLVTLRRELISEIALVLGIPREFFESGGGASSREAYRRFLFSTIEPLANLLIDEYREKLELSDFDLSFDKLAAADILGRSRAFGSLVKAGMDKADALRLVGLSSEEEGNRGRIGGC